MATLYWRGAVSSDVQVAANWSYAAPGWTGGTEAPPAAPNTPGAGDTVVFPNFVGGAWNPIYEPAGLIGSGITHTVLYEVKSERFFAKNLGTQTNFLKVHASNIDLQALNVNHIKSLNSNCQITVNPTVTNPNTYVAYYFAGNCLTFKVVTPERPELYNTNTHMWFGIPIGQESGSVAFSVSGGINMTQGSLYRGKINIGNQATLVGQSSFRGNGLNLMLVSRGMSLGTVQFYGNDLIQDTNFSGGRNTCLMLPFGITQSATGPLGSKSAIRNFNVIGTVPATNLSESAYVDATGVCFDNLNLFGSSVFVARANIPAATNFTYIQTFNYNSSPYNDANGVYYPIFRSYRDDFAIGGPSETFGGSINSALGASYDTIPGILIYGDYEMDIV
jgi:hypothetical protein